MSDKNTNTIFIRWRNIRYIRWRWENCNFSAWWECVWCHTDSWSHGHKSNKHWIWTELKMTMMTRMLWKTLTSSYNHNVIVEAKKRRDCKAGCLGYKRYEFVPKFEILHSWKNIFFRLIGFHSWVYSRIEKNKGRPLFVVLAIGCVILCTSQQIPDVIFEKHIIIAYVTKLKEKS